MNVQQQNIDNVSAIVKIQVVAADYQDHVEKSLRNIRQKANVPGFRPGKTPKSLIKKMYEKSAMVEEINRMVSEQLYKHIQENNIQILGEPLPNITVQQEIDFATQTDFEFCFDIAIAPAINISLSKSDEVNFYKIEVTEEMVTEQLNQYTQRFGSTQPAEQVEGKDMVKGDIVEMDENGNEKENGHTATDTLLIPFYLKDDAEKAKFNGAKVGENVVFNPHKAAGESKAEVAHVLKVSKEEAETMTSDFKFTIKEVTRFTPAEVNEELFKKVFGEEAGITTEEAFIAKVKETIVLMMNPESEYKLGLDAKALVAEKIGELEYPVEILKRWLLETKEEKSEEEIEKQMPTMLKELTWHLAKEKIVKDAELKVNEEDLMAIAKVDVKMQFAQYGMNEIPEEYLVQYASELLKKKENARGFVDRAIEEKVYAWIKEQITVKETPISREEFYKQIGE